MFAWLEGCACSHVVPMSFHYPKLLPIFSQMKEMKNVHFEFVLRPTSLHCCIGDNEMAGCIRPCRVIVLISSPAALVFPTTGSCLVVAFARIIILPLLLLPLLHRHGFMVD